MVNWLSNFFSSQGQSSETPQPSTHLKHLDFTQSEPISAETWLDLVHYKMAKEQASKRSNYRQFRENFYGDGGGYDQDYFDVKESALFDIAEIEALKEKLDLFFQDLKYLPVHEFNPCTKERLGTEIIPFLPHDSELNTYQIDTSKLPRRLKNTWGMEYQLIYPGIFRMGRSIEEIHTYTTYWEMNVIAGEGDQHHQVELTQPFYLQTTPVTQAQWLMLMDTNPSYFTGEIHPVENISWLKTQEFLTKISAEEGLQYQLPTDAEWEYACRAGEQENFTDRHERAWSSDNANYKTHPVGLKKANAWGLYDMQGNVWEWVQDSHIFFDGSKQTDPCYDHGHLAYKVIRGGSWQTRSPQCFIGERESARPGETHGPEFVRDFSVQRWAESQNLEALPPDIGFRTAIHLTPNQQGKTDG